jgi:nucleoredoxin
VYKELSTKGDFEIIFISADEDEESFNGYFSKMPWLAIPFSDSEKRDLLDEEFKVRGIPTLVIIGEDGKVVSDSGVEIIREYGIEGYPFTEERIKELKDQEEAARRNQSLGSLLVTRSRDFVISPNGNRVTFEFQWCCLLYKNIRKFEICYSSPLISVFVLNVKGACF